MMIILRDTISKIGFCTRLGSGVGHNADYLPQRHLVRPGLDCLCIGCLRIRSRAILTDIEYVGCNRPELKLNHGRKAQKGITSTYAHPILETSIFHLHCLCHGNRPFMGDWWRHCNILAAGLCGTSGSLCIEIFGESEAGEHVVTTVEKQQRFSTRRRRVKRARTYHYLRRRICVRGKMRVSLGQNH